MTPAGGADACVTLDPSQVAAVGLMRTARFGIVTGGPGTGKSTLVRTAIADMPSGDVALAAPTGKAARRIASTSGRHASTIHRLLGWQRGGAWTYTEQDPLPHDLVVIDESSMLDYALARALMAGARSSRVVLVGDADQLPPVGVGRMFAELCELPAGMIPTVRLTTVHRQSADSWVAHAAPRIIRGEAFALETCAGMRWVDAGGDGADVVAAVCADVVAHGERVVMTPQRTGPAGTVALNRALDPVVNQLPVSAVTWDRGESGPPLRRGGRIINTKNDYDRDVMNGELGIIMDITDRALLVRYEDLDLTTEYTRADAGGLESAYALTVHRMQGSEAGHAIVVCHSTHSHMMSRSILYTAVTRAKSHVTLVGNPKGVALALRTPGTERMTSLGERITGVLS